MYKLKSETGFSSIKLIAGVALVLIIGGAVGLTIWKLGSHKLATHSATKTTQSTIPSPKVNQSSSVVVYSSDKKVQFTLPSTWQIIDTTGNAQVISSAQGNPGCFDPQDPSSCVYVAVFQPKALSSAKASSNAIWTFQVEKSSLPLQQIIQDRMGSPPNSQKISTLNGYISYINQVQVGNYAPDGTTDFYAFLQYKGYTVMIYNRVKDISHSATHPANQDYTSYVPQLLNIVQSARLNL